MPLIQLAIRQIVVSIIGLLALITSNPSVSTQEIESIKPIQISVNDSGSIEITPPQILLPEITKSQSINSPIEYNPVVETNEVLNTKEAQRKLELLKGEVKDLEKEIVALKERMSKLPPVSNTIPIVVAIPSLDESEEEYIEEVVEGDVREYGSPADSVVHIACSHKQGNLTNLITGSGVIIDSSGVVLTNAHVGFLFLLEESGYDCAINKENIPLGYKAEVVFIPKEWARDNSDILSEETPKGTGENDFAILFITEGTNSAVQLPKDFIETDILLNTEDLNEGDDVLVIGFPGINTGNIGKDTLGALDQEQTRIKDIFTFHNNTLDIFSTDLISIARQGISGGGVFNEDGEFIGLVTTITDPKGSYGSINALSSGYINRQLGKYTDKGLNYFASPSASEYINQFSSDAEEIRDIIE